MASQKHIEKTLLVFKPDSIQRGIMGEILTRFERVGLKIVAAKMVSPDREHYHKHYEGIGTMISRHGEHIFNTTVDTISLGPVIAFVLEGVEAIAIARKLTGATEPKSAATGTIRGDYCHTSYGRSDSEGKGIQNLIHTSANAEEADQEIKLWFADSEIFDYEAPHEKFTR
jgi:nucleoside-diphosphate kinase